MSILLIVLLCCFTVPVRLKPYDDSRSQNIPSAEEIQNYIKNNPPNPNDKAFFSKGLFQGDILKYKYHNLDAEKQEIDTSEEVRAETVRWPNKLIPYKFYEKIDPVTKQFAEEAMNDIAAKTCVRFIPLTYEKDYIKISPGGSCAASIGYQKGEQMVSLNPGCQDDMGATQHELLHALGMIHEQARPDRDNYVYINYDNLGDPAYREQFYIFSNAEVTDLGLPYDYDSVMHYPVNAFAKDMDHPTVIPRDKGKKIGNRVKLSALDIKRINRLYRCDDNPNDYQEPPIPKEVAAKYRQTFKLYDKLCDGVKDTPEGWDEKPDTCLQMCSRLDMPVLGPDGKNLFNMLGTKRCKSKNTLCKGKDDTSQKDCSRADGKLQKWYTLGDLTYAYKQAFMDNMVIISHDVFEMQLFDVKRGVNFCFKYAINDDIPSCYSEEIFKPLIDRYCRLGGYFTMPDTDQCLHVSNLCDGRNDTVDGADENVTLCRDLCSSESTGLSEGLFSFPEDGYRCVAKTKLCNHLYSGELIEPKNCLKYCKGNGYAPVGKSLQCLHWNQLCDGTIDMATVEDENPAICKSICEAAAKDLDGEVFVAPNTSRCMSKRSLCDGEQYDDKDTSEDSSVCKKYCQGFGYFTAVDTDQCLRLTDLCDGKMDTRTGWDERADNCKKYCENAEDWPPEGQMLQLDPVSKRCMLVNGSKQIIIETTTASANENKRITILSRGHKVLGCKDESQRVQVVSAAFISDEPDPSCPDTDYFKEVAGKCDQMGMCGFDPIDPSTKEGCSERSLEIVYRCTAADVNFEIDPDTEALTGVGGEE